MSRPRIFQLFVNCYWICCYILEFWLYSEVWKKGLFEVALNWIFVVTPCPQSLAFFQVTGIVSVDHGHINMKLPDGYGTSFLYYQKNCKLQYQNSKWVYVGSLHIRDTSARIVFSACCSFAKLRRSFYFTWCMVHLSQYDIGIEVLDTHTDIKYQPHFRDSTAPNDCHFLQWFKWNLLFSKCILISRLRTILNSEQYSIPFSSSATSSPPKSNSLPSISFKFYYSIWIVAKLLHLYRKIYVRQQPLAKVSRGECVKGSKVGLKKVETFRIGRRLGLTEFALRQKALSCLWERQVLM